MVKYGIVKIGGLFLWTIVHILRVAHFSDYKTTKQKTQKPQTKKHTQKNHAYNYNYNKTVLL